ncbi:MAG: hypothetical protein FJ137_10480 [Deltaproteobacteria bacterium]|nr:hypothetical protein [Deltaproteobacteria bacterium]
MVRTVTYLFPEQIIVELTDPSLSEEDCLRWILAVLAGEHRPAASALEAALRKRRAAELASRPKRRGVVATLPAWDSVAVDSAVAPIEVHVTMSDEEYALFFPLHSSLDPDPTPPSDPRFVSIRRHEARVILRALTE